MCAGCRRRFPRASLIRVVRAADGAVLPDLQGRLPGRGAYLCPNMRCLVQAEHSRALARTFHSAAPLEDPIQMVNTCAAAYRQQALGLLMHSVRIDRMALGRDRAQKALDSGSVALLLLAADDSDSLIQQVEEEAARRRVKTRRDFNAAQLSQIARGLPLNVIGLLHRGIARRVNEKLGKAALLRDSLE
jgi:predicted RNA-binding protein YlxR (DUF448 family)